MYDIVSFTRWDGLFTLQPSDDPLDPHPLEGGLHQDDAAAEGTPGKIKGWLGRSGRAEFLYSTAH
jgi:hypothetical protein